MTNTHRHDVLYCALALQLGAASKDQIIDAMKGIANGDCELLANVLDIEPTQQRAIEHLVKIREKRVEADSGTDADVHNKTIGMDFGRIQPSGAGRLQPEADDRFEILRLHKEGGLGQVFLAKDRQLGRNVALKEIRDQFVGDVHNRNRFTLEAEVTARLEHPGIVPVYARGVYRDGRPYYVMKFIHGETMRSAINEHHEACESGQNDYNQSVGLRNLLRRFRDVCNAVDYAHERGVLHRDLKPANIMFGKFGETLVVDWGLAQLRGDSPDEFLDSTMITPTDPVMAGQYSVGSRQGRAIGSAGFMSPEQARGERESLTAATDVYGLGAILYAILVNRAPVDGLTHAEYQQKTIEGKIDNPRTFDRSIPASLAAITMKALSTEADDRYDSVRELADDLDRFLASEPVVAHHEPIIERLIRLGRRNQTALTAAAAALLLVAIVATASAFQISRNYEQSKYLVGFIRKSFERMPPEAVESNDLSVFIQSLGDSYLENDELFERAGQYAVDFHQAIGNAHLRLGSDSDDLEQRLNQYEKTTSFFVRSLTTLRDSGCKEEDLEVVVHNLAGSYFGTGVVLEKMAKQRTLDDNLAASTLDELARAQGAFADAKKVYQQSYEIKRKKHGIANNKTLGAKEMVGRCLYRQAKIYRTNSQPNLAMESATESVSVLNGVYEDRLALSGLDKKTLYAKERLNEARGLLSQIGKSSDSN